MTNVVKRGCIIIHGLSGTPANVGTVAGALLKAGYIVNAPFLPGHGSSPEALLNVRWADWYAAVMDAYNEMRRETRRISAVGLSLGGLLALYLAEEMKWGVRAVVSISTPLVLTGIIERIIHPLVRYTPARYLYKFSRKDWEKSILDPEGRKEYMRNSYDKIAVRSVFEIFDFKKEVARRLPLLVSPILAIHGKSDKVAPLKNVELLKKSLRSGMVDVMVLEKTGHVATLDCEKDKIVNATVAFLNRFS